MEESLIEAAAVDPTLHRPRCEDTAMITYATLGNVPAENSAILRIGSRPAIHL
jgi:hypothetical protein